MENFRPLPRKRRVGKEGENIYEETLSIIGRKEMGRVTERQIKL